MSLIQFLEEIEFEPKVYGSSPDKYCDYTFNKSLDRIKAAGYLRHARPSEVFSLFIADFENNLPDKQKEIVKDMLKNHGGEWLSMAFERECDTLIAYTDPEGLVFNGDYVKDNFRFSSRNEFKITEIKSEEWIDLKNFENGLVELLYTRSFDKLPMAMQEGDKSARIYLPPNGVIWPLGRGNVNDYYDVYGHVWIGGASRGIRNNRE